MVPPGTGLAKKAARNRPQGTARELPMEKASTLPQKFQPELYCLRCQRMEWDDEADDYMLTLPS